MIVLKCKYIDFTGMVGFEGIRNIEQKISYHELVFVFQFLILLFLIPCSVILTNTLGVC